jgi:hypothetical protein
MNSAIGSHPYSLLTVKCHRHDEQATAEWMISISLNHGKNGETEECASAI